MFIFEQVDVKKAQPSQNKGGMMNWGPMMMRGGSRGAGGSSRGGRGGRGGGGRTDWSGWGAGSYNAAYGGYAPADGNLINTFFKLEFLGAI